MIDHDLGDDRSRPRRYSDARVGGRPVDDDEGAMMLRTRLTDRLGIEHPIVLAPMAQVSEVSLAAAVSNGGGLGTFGAAGRIFGLTEQHVRDTVTALRDRTDKPFGAGFITQLIA